MKKIFLSLVVGFVLISAGIMAYLSQKQGIVEQNIEALSKEDDGIWLHDCTMYFLWGGPYSIRYVCRPGTLSNYVLPCSYEGTGGVTMGRCYLEK